MVLVRKGKNRLSWQSIVGLLACVSNNAMTALPSKDGNALSAGRALSVPPLSNRGGALLHKKLTKTHTIPKLWNGIRSFNKIRIITILEVRFTSIFYQKWRNGGQNGTKGIYTGIKKQTTCQWAFTRTACRTSAYMVWYKKSWQFILKDFIIKPRE